MGGCRSNHKLKNRVKAKQRKIVILEGMVKKIENMAVRKK